MSYVSSYIFLYALLLVILCSLQIVVMGNPMTWKGDISNETIPARLGPDPGYIIIESSYGLSNRLRVLAAYLFITPIRFDNAKIVMIWDVNDACPSHFLSLFEPLPNVIFATNDTKHVFDKHAKAIYPDTSSVLSYLLKMHGFPRKRNAHWNNPRWGEIEFMTYAQFHPRREILARVIDYVNRYDICHAHAMHIRSTEFFSKIAKVIPYGMAHVENRPNNESVFLLTDHYSIQDLFLSTYGPQRILIYEKINATVNTWPRQINHTDQIPTAKNLRPIASAVAAEQNIADYRFTTLEQTVTEVLIAAHAKTFRGSPVSSLTDVVNIYTIIGKTRGWCQSDVYTHKRLDT